MKISIKTAAEDLLTFRSDTGLTQGQLSEKTGVSRITIGKIEKGDIPRASTIYKLNQFIEKGNNVEKD